MYNRHINRINISFSITVNSRFVVASLLYLYLYKEDNAFISHINREIEKC